MYLEVPLQLSQPSGEELNDSDSALAPIPTRINVHWTQMYIQSDLHEYIALGDKIVEGPARKSGLTE